MENSNKGDKKQPPHLRKLEFCCQKTLWTPSTKYNTLILE